MLRGLADAIFLFLVPFVFYAAFLTLRRRFPMRLASWTDGPMLRLVTAGLALAGAGALFAGIFSNRYLGDYIPAHMEKGVLVPGKME